MNKLMLVIPALAMLVMALGLVQAEGPYTVTVNAQVAPYLQVTPNYNVVNFGTLYLGPTGITDKPAPNQEQGIYNYTITTNAMYNVSVRADNFSEQFTINNLKFQAVPNNPRGVNLNNPNQPPIVLSTSSQVYPYSFYPQDSVLYHGYYLTVPSNTPAGSYRTTVYIDIYNV